MSNSYRLRTQVGVDKSLKVLLDQDFEFLEILSLKILQSQIYTRPCSDYGVVIGRVTANDGFGIPNAKVSIFIPLDSQDEENPVIADLYPYKSLSDLNEDGYRYNLLPYTQQHSGHAPTGTFFSREDVLTDTTLIEVFDKYYRYTARTNESGDYMIFGVPIGSQTIHVDIDLSDIGEFSLSPQDLVRMGVATPSQVAGTKFKSSSNLNELPQIISLNRTIEIEPLWGQTDICNIGITRTDFDLTSEANITITPTAIFMGSIFSANDDQFLKKNCKPKVKQGTFCNLVTGFGEILAIRQTIEQDENGRPVLETVELQEGGQVIDDNGTWLIDVPMNLDYVITNEFGERVISDDPKKGIPTKGKYRFKVKWNQSPSLSETVKRGYFLVPNVKEWGWNNSNNDPLNNTITSDEYNEAKASYAFSLDWNDYGWSGGTNNLFMIQEAIDCKDRFYLMNYNKVYTVSQIIDQFRKGVLPNRMVSIKNILDDACESENNKFPTNDAVFRFDIMYLLFVIMMYIFKPILLILLVVVHILGWLMKWILGPVLSLLIIVLYPLILLVCYAVKVFKPSLECPQPGDGTLKRLVKKMLTLYKYFTNIKLPNLSYPDCELCDCKEGQSLESNEGDGDTDPSGTGANLDDIYESYGINIDSYLTQTQLPQYYSDSLVSSFGEDEANIVATLLSGQILPNSPGSTVPQLLPYPDNNKYIFTNSLTLSERLNLFNTKAKYFDEEDQYSFLVNPGGGVNRIKVTFQSDVNNSNTKYHYDNVVALLIDASNAGEMIPGALISFQDPALSKDINITGVTDGNQFGTYSITGTPINTASTVINLFYANPDGSGTVLTPTQYTITQDPDDANYHKFPMDIEYYQVITAMTFSNYIAACDPSGNPNSLSRRFLDNTMLWHEIGDQGCIRSFEYTNPIRNFEDYENQVVTFLVRGVDPNSSKRINRYDLSVLFNKTMGTPGYAVTGLTRFNIPILGSYKSISHTNMISSNATVTDTLNGTNLPLYHKSFHFQPSIGNGGFSAFSSDLPTYYSSLDNTIPSFAPSGGIVTPGVFPPVPTTAPQFTNAANLSTLGSRVLTFDGNKNGFAGHFSTNVIASPCFVGERYQFVNNANPSYNRGYYPNEIIEGGSYALQYLDMGVLTQPNAWGFLYSPKYTGNVAFNNNVTATDYKIVMRSDRLPTSTTNQDVNGNSLMLHNNPGFALFIIDDDGTVTSVPQSQNTPNFGDPEDNIVNADENTGVDNGNHVLDTFSCAGMVPLSCYEGNSGTITVLPPGNECYENGDGDEIMQNGCYILVSSLLETLINGKDFKLIGEWTSRIQITFAACRNVWSHIFTNSWINGTLYAFPFKNDRLFTPPTTDSNNPFEPPIGPPIFTPNTAYSIYCNYPIYLHPTNNFYYRSSPYNASTQKFIGSAPPNTSSKGNTLNLKYPTTIMDLGPRNFYQQELSMSDDFDGYVVNKIRASSYTSVDEILNLLIISRLLNQSFLSAIAGAGGSNALSYFNQRSKQFVDGDYAQLISISSELGVIDFDSTFYDDSSIFYSDSDSDDVVIGIFFSSDTQTRDFITPKRTIIDLTLPSNNNCAFSSFSVFSQEVPFYQWEIKTGDKPDGIFGSQSNNWYTNSDVDSGGFLKYRYQSMDRLNPSSRYFRSNNYGTLQNQYTKGYIYAVSANTGGITSSFSNVHPNTPLPRVITHGDPFHFYFGLKKGSTAFDRFARQWINFETIVD